MIAIVNVDLNWAIGYNGNLQATIEPDLHRFKDLTYGKVIVYGRKTLSTFPNEKPLPGRLNIILSRDQRAFPLSVKGEQPLVCDSIESFFEVHDNLISMGKYKPEDFIIIGGESVYDQFMPYIDLVHVTQMNFSFPCDAYFKNLDESPEWEKVYFSPWEEFAKIRYRFTTYKRIER